MEEIRTTKAGSTGPLYPSSTRRGRRERYGGQALGQERTGAATAQCRPPLPCPGLLQERSIRRSRRLCWTGRDAVCRTDDGRQRGPLGQRRAQGAVGQPARVRQGKKNKVSGYGCAGARTDLRRHGVGWLIWSTGTGNGVPVRSAVTGHSTTTDDVPCPVAMASCAGAGHGHAPQPTPRLCLGGRLHAAGACQACVKRAGWRANELAISATWTGGTPDERLTGLACPSGK